MSAPRPPQPPALAQRALRWLLPSGKRGLSILGDLAHDYARIARMSRIRAIVWYSRMVITIGLPYLALRIRARLRGHPSAPLVGPPPTSVRTRRIPGMTLGNFGKDLRHATRSLRRSPGFAAVTVGTLALAIGANAAIFSVVDTVLLDALPFQHSDRLIRIAASAPGTDMSDEFGPSAEFFLQYRDGADLLEDISTVSLFTSTLRTDDRVERVWMSGGTPSLFSTLGVTPILGRLPVPEDESDVVVISHGLWTTWFGADPDVIGRSYSVAGTMRTIIGVMGADFWFPNHQPVLWIPQVFRAESVTPGRWGLYVIARVAPNVERDAVVAQLSQLARRIPERFGGSASYARLVEAHRPVVRPLREEMFGSLSRALWVLFGAVGVVLLIACANVANLFLVRFGVRQREMVVRRAIGATRTRLLSLQMSEALVVAFAAGTLAVLLASIGVSILLTVAPPNVPRLHETHVTISTLAFTLIASIVTAFVCGLVPAIRHSAPNMARLRDGGRRATQRRHWGRDGLVVAQTALAMVLLVGSGLLVRSFLKLNNVDPGYETENLFTFQIAPVAEHLSDGPTYARFHIQFMERLAGLPGVESVGIVENVPLDEGLRQVRFRTDQTANDTTAGPLINVTFTGGDYFRTMGIDVLHGRTFTDADHVVGNNTAIVSQSAANLLWPGQNPIGKRLRGEDQTVTWGTVVGVVEDVMQYGFRGDFDPLVYLPMVGPTPVSWWLSSPAYVVRTSRAEVIAPEIRSLVREVAPTAPMYRTYTMAGLASASMVQLSFTMFTLGVASALALILGAIGLYGVLSYVVSERTQEIGVRMALGAQASWVRRMVVAQGARVTGLGILIGAAIAIVTTRFLGGLLFGVPPIDAGTFVGMSAAMIVVALVASYLPARRASRMDPIDSLRSE